MRAIGASEKSASVIAGSASWPEARARTVSRSPAMQRVDQVEAGDVRWRQNDDVEPAERRRRPAEQIVEDVDQHQAGEEDRQADAGRRDEQRQR